MDHLQKLNTPEASEQKTPSWTTRLRRKLGLVVGGGFDSYIAKENARTAEKTSASYEQEIVDGSVGLNRQIAEAIRGIVDLPGSNRTLGGVERIDEDQSSWQSWDANVRVGSVDARGDSAYLGLENGGNKLSFTALGKEVDVSEIAMSLIVKREETSQGKQVSTASILMLNGSKDTMTSEKRTKWMLEISPDGEVTSARTNTGQSPNALTRVSSETIENLDGMLRVLQLAIAEERTIRSKRNA